MTSLHGTIKRLCRIGAIIAVFFLAGEMSGSVCNACTIVVKADRDIILVGNNEDYLEPRTKVWFFPAAAGIHGRAVWGFDRELFPYQGGMNDAGLFVDINAIGFTGWAGDSSKPDLPGDEIQYFLSHCATVDEVVRTYQTHNVDLGWAKYVFADAGGNSAIVEWLDGKLNVIRRQGDFQVSTNYASPLEHTEPRNRISAKILSGQQEPAIDLVRRALASYAFSTTFCQTLYSTICDLKARRFWVYHFHNFEECVIFDLDEEMKKGKAEHRIPELFAVRPYSEELWLRGGGSQLGAKTLVEFMEANGAEKGVARFREMAAEKKTYNRYVFEEWIIRDAGRVLQSRGRIREAAAIYGINVEENPESWEAYYDLAEAGAALGDRDAARRNYRLAIDHNPDAARAASITEKLKALEE